MITSGEKNPNTVTDECYISQIKVIQEKSSHLLLSTENKVYFTNNLKNIFIYSWAESNTIILSYPLNYMLPQKKCCHILTTE